MGSWTRKYFERDVLPKNAIIISGTTKEEQKQKYLSLFDEVLFHRADLFERYILKKNGIEYLLLLNIYGAPLIIDLVHVLQEGAVGKAILLGAACGLDTNLSIGDIVLPSEVQALDAILEICERTCYAQPDIDFFWSITGLLDKENLKYFEGKTISVPSVFTRVDRDLFDSDAIAMEMECSSFLHFATRQGINAAAILVISDTAGHELTDCQDKRYASMLQVMKMLMQDGTVFNV